MSGGSSRCVYRRADLSRLFEPSSIAIVGMSLRQGSFGERTYQNLTKVGGYAGRIHLVNAKYSTIGGRPCYPDLNSLPEVPDCVILAVPRELAEPVVEACAEIGVGGVVLFASGYREVGQPERIAQQERLSSIARGCGTRILGPNCLGYANHWSKVAASFTGVNAPKNLQAHAIGVVSQSGALGFAFNQAVERGVSIGMLLTAGNSCDVDVADEIAYLAEEPRCKAIACLFEGLTDPERLIEAAEIACVNDKPIVICKIGRGSQGLEAVNAHTGTPAGSYAEYQALFRRTGMVSVDGAEALVETASFFAKARRPAARGVAVAATSGGAAIMAADHADEHGVSLPQPSAETQAVLRQHVPEYGSLRNPCDVTGQVTSNPASLMAVGTALMSDPQYGVVVMPYPQINADSSERNFVFSAIAERFGKLACNVWLSEWQEGPGATEAEALSHLAVFRSMGRCFFTIAAWQERDDFLRARALQVD